MTIPSVTKDKISNFNNFVEGWHFGEGSAPSKLVIDAAHKINKAMADAGFLETDAFLGASGNIQVNAYSDNVYIETIIDNNNRIEFIFEKNESIQIYDDDLSLPEAIVKIGFWGKQWDISESFTETTMTLGREDLQALSFPHQQLMAEYLSLTLNASKPVVEVDASISGFTTPRMPVFNQYFLKSTQAYYPMNASS
jgi:hypothetical protein